MRSLRKIPFGQVLGPVLGAVAGAACLAVLTFSPVGQTGTPVRQTGTPAGQAGGVGAAPASGRARARPPSS